MQYTVKILVFCLRIKVNSRVYILTVQMLFSLRNAGNSILEENIPEPLEGHAYGACITPSTRNLFSWWLCGSAKNCLGMPLIIYIKYHKKIPTYWLPKCQLTKDSCWTSCDVTGHDVLISFYPELLLLIHHRSEIPTA